MIENVFNCRNFTFCSKESRGNVRFWVKF